MIRLKRRRELLFPVFPTLMTLGNAVCGFGSITFAAKAVPQGPHSNDLLLIAGLLILAASVFDMLDGQVARWTNQTSKFGMQLDSLCDAVSFGAAPAFLLLKFPDLHGNRLVWVIASLYLVCALLRLARFNVQNEEENSHEWFTGLPSPAAAGAIVSFAIAMPGLADWTDPSMSETAQWFGNCLITITARGLPVFALVVACLMVSRIRYPHYLNELVRGRRPFQHLMEVVFAIAAVAAVHELALPIIFSFFVLASPTRALRDRFLRRPAPSEAPKSLSN